LLIDDFQRPDRASNGNRWRFFSDQVMGGVSRGSADIAELDGRRALRLRGDVSLENNGGFTQMAIDLGVDGGDFDAGDYTGVAVTARGDGKCYAVSLRSADIRRPWQSYRSEFIAADTWTTHYLPFAGFRPHRIDQPLNLHRLRRLGIIAIGEPGAVDIAVACVTFYRQGDHED
jgi:hypothetical protein